MENKMSGWQKAAWYAALILAVCFNAFVVVSFGDWLSF